MLEVINEFGQIRRWLKIEKYCLILKWQQGKEKNVEGKKWLKQYGVHALVCIGVFLIAFCINLKINLDRSHTYTVSGGVYSILKGVTKVEISGNKLEITGWGFDTEIYNESSYYELILQDTETGKALWPKMEKNPEVVEIAERYTDGGDYSGASFGGSIKASQLNEESVYEILLRYTTDYVDENGNEQQYVRTVSTDEFIYQGQMTEYNPQTFVAPEIAGTEFEKELEGARLFHYFEEGMWVYYTEEKLYYIIKNDLLELDRAPRGILHWFIRDIQELPKERQQYGFGNNNFSITGIVNVDNSYIVKVVPVPNEKVTYIGTGIFYSDTGSVCSVLKQWK